MHDDDDLTAMWLCTRVACFLQELRKRASMMDAFSNCQTPAHTAPKCRRHTRVHDFGLPPDIRKGGCMLTNEFPGHACACMMKSTFYAKILAHRRFAEWDWRCCQCRKHDRVQHARDAPNAPPVVDPKPDHPSRKHSPIQKPWVDRKQESMLSNDAKDTCGPKSEPLRQRHSQIHNCPHPAAKGTCGCRASQENTRVTESRSRCCCGVAKGTSGCWPLHRKILLGQGTSEEGIVRHRRDAQRY
jgi:hypothetical protein